MTDENGRPLRVEYESTRAQQRLSIYVPDARDATRTVVIHYEVANAIRFFPEESSSGFHDELY